MLSRIARQFHLPEEKLRSRLNSIRREATARPRSQRADNDNDRSAASQPLRLADLVAWDRGVLELIILDPTLVPRVAVGVDPAGLYLGRRPPNLPRLLPPGRRSRRKATSAACSPSSTSRK